MQKNSQSKKGLDARRLTYLRAFRAAYTRVRSEYTFLPISLYEVSQLSDSGEMSFFFLQAGQPLPIFDDKVDSVFIQRVPTSEVICLLDECIYYGIK